ncbi:helix-turn-helix domain-containing protein [Staphylococcus saccharolyticus]|uniref:helix-turn-helix domain-containing protein n=1 Tax=Staphylococcus saccharolyticus TaxID=33028 RepID=UPI00102D71AE|nr:helix-turn-helix domain-containing protein [Staphylococcus saccharolyticus]MBL7573093.1 helix-turn-helix domain-containing protein [Staphylococcus saccharolyticus]MBL7583973.1 helix-turn-helix domain-containing protein [Staphylococcus saccharolyticus]MBL7638708.1 helix-turn-helix domain-containing protein [Staphylococcus saccharolyticus]QRJ67800.1 helix-turn-helix domain-containing protein [Staphylococcus saccharolyticus]TAA93620.1 transcriptional regulator [Staphylococcus saccharolyticus]
MKTVGEVLKGRRERLGMTLNELEQRTQLKRQTLIHIENNDFDQLAKKDYTEGFIRKYANVVNIEPNQLIEAHQDEIPNNQNQIDEVIQTFSNGQVPSYRSKSKETLQLLSFIGAVMIISLVIWILAVLTL